MVRRGLHFGQVTQTGVVFHMLSVLGSTGRLGLTAVGNSPVEARTSFDEAKRVLDEEARFDELNSIRSLVDGPLTAGHPK